MVEEDTEIDCVLRPMNCEINLLSRSDGSTMFMQGDTTIVAGVNGPMEAKSQKMAYDKLSIEVTYTPLTGPAKVDDRLIETYIRETCESAILVSLHPNTMICINLQEVQDSGGLLACAINASCLALINSGLSMKFTIAAVSCMIEKETGKIIMDPDSTQLKNAKAEFTYAFDSINKDIVCCHSVGRFSQSEFLASVDKCKQTPLGGPSRCLGATLSCSKAAPSCARRSFLQRREGKCSLQGYRNKMARQESVARVGRDSAGTRGEVVPEQTNLMCLPG